MAIEDYSTNIFYLGLFMGLIAGIFGNMLAISVFRLVDDIAFRYCWNAKKKITLNIILLIVSAIAIIILLLSFHYAFQEALCLD
jgi:H+/Cl- antiporter ClcA